MSDSKKNKRSRSQTDDDAAQLRKREDDDEEHLIDGQPAAMQNIRQLEEDFDTEKDNNTDCRRVVRLYKWTSAHLFIKIYYFHLYYICYI